MSEQKMTPKKALMAVLPVFISIILIILIVVTVSTIKKCNHKETAISNPNEVYLTIGDMDITNERLYIYLKQSYGVSELLRLIDTALYKDDVAKVSDEDLEKYVNKSLYGVEDLADYDGDPDEVYQDTVKSLLMTGLLTEAESTDKTKVDAVIKSFYRLQLARENWAKEEYLKRYLEEKKANGNESYFTDEEIETYYTENYTGETIGFFIPFTSLDAAYAMMNRYGINTQEKVLDNKGWVTSVYDYNKDTTINPSQYLSSTTVMKNFFDMYNEVYAYQNGNQPIITNNDYEKVFDSMKTATLAKANLAEALALLITNANGFAVLPTEIEVTNNIDSALNKATVEWSLEDNAYLALEDNKLSQKVLVNDGEKTVKLTAKVTYNEKVVEETFSLKVKNATTNTLTASITGANTEATALKTEVESSLKAMLDGANLTAVVNLPTTIKCDNTEVGDVAVSWTIDENAYGTISANSLSIVNPKEASASAKLKATYTLQGQITTYEYDATFTRKDIPVNVETTETFDVYELTEEFLNAHQDDTFRMQWTTAELTAINTTLSSYLKADSTTLKLSDNPDDFYLSYTVKPVSVGNYYALMIKLAKVDAPSQENVKDEIVSKKQEELLTENNINKLIYTRRQEADLQIFDNYLEAIYDYEYTTFFETTLSLKATDYDVYENSKKKTTTDVASFKVGNETVTITSDQLFKELEVKYGPSISLNLIHFYEVLSNELGEFNKIYNPYTKTAYNKDYFNDILETEVSSLRKNFELDYFTYSYLASYGFTPNFPASYGWRNFAKDYFGSLTDEELAASSSFGGTIYNETYQALMDSLYTDEDVNKEMQNLVDKWFSVDVMNLVISVDENYDSNPDTEFDWSKESIYTGVTYEQLAKELAKLMFEKQAETGETTFTAAMTSLVALYNEADMNDTVVDPSKSIYDTNLWAKYKKAGIVVKWEAVQTYSWANSPENTTDTSSSKLVQEFIDAITKLYHEVPTNLLDTTFDVPLFSDEAFHTEYGYHMVAISKATKATELPTADEIALYKAFNKVADYKEATTKYGKDQLEAAQKALDDLLAAKSLASDYTIDEDTTKKLTTWFDEAVKVVEASDLLSDKLTAGIDKLLADNKLKYTDSNDLARLQLILKFSAEEKE